MKRLWLIVAGLVFGVLLFALQFHLLRRSSMSLTTRVLLLVLINVNVLALLTLVFFVGKSLVKLYLERKRKVLGSKFKTKIVVIFGILISIPSALLFLGASGLVSNYIDRWFTPQFRQPFERTLDVAKSVYEIQRRHTLEAARTLQSRGALPMEYTVTRLSEVPENATEVIREAFEGKEGTEVVSGEDGDIIRAVAPDPGGPGAGVLVVESKIPASITASIDRAKRAYEEYVQLEGWKLPLTLNYLLFLGFFTLIVIFITLWVSLRLAKTITDPIETLALATGRVAAGDLSVNVDAGRDDEIGLLMSSFNNMVAELKRGEESLQAAYVESDRRRVCMENILENIQSGVISLDAEGSCITINQAACAILDVAPHEVIGRNYREILSSIQSESLQEFVLGIRLKTLESVEREVWATLKGKRRLIKVSIMSLRETGSYLGLLVVFDDLTDVMKAQRALAWQEVARRMAHEIKNPLTPIRLSTERMLRKWEHKDQDFDQVFERSTRTIIKEVDSLRNLVDEFSRFGKMPEILKAPADLGAIIEEVVNLYRDYKGLSITVSVTQDMPLIDLDREQFKRVLINLFDNAIHAMAGSGAIEVRAAADLAANKVVLDVADNGPGIRDEDKDKLFVPYFSTKDGGTGLGLAIAGKIVSEHRGYLRVKDNQPSGTVFTIEMPVRER